MKAELLDFKHKYGKDEQMRNQVVRQMTNERLHGSPGVQSSQQRAALRVTNLNGDSDLSSELSYDTDLTDASSASGKRSNPSDNIDPGDLPRRLNTITVGVSNL